MIVIGNMVIDVLVTNNLHTFTMVEFYLLIIIISLIVLVYIHLVNKQFKIKYPYLFALLNVSLIFMLTISSYLVLMYPAGRGSMGPPPSPRGPPGPGGSRPPGGPGPGGSFVHNPHNSQRDPSTDSSYPDFMERRADGTITARAHTPEPTGPNDLFRSPGPTSPNSTERPYTPERG